jgi:hypothetical protein
MKDRLFATGWVHVFEEDTAEGAVYRPEDGDIPLSRRPRERIKLESNGTATLSTLGEDDRYVGRPATWKEQKGELIIRPKAGGPALRIVDRRGDRWIIK